jgi:hypothetical protein
MAAGTPDDARLAEPVWHERRSAHSSTAGDAWMKNAGRRGAPMLAM